MLHDDNTTNNQVKTTSKNIFRVCKNKDNPYVQINKTILNDKRVSWKAKGIHAYMLSMPDDWTFYRSELVKHATDGKDSLNAGIKELVTFGYADVTVTRDSKGRIKEWVTTIYEVPKPIVAGISSRNGFSTSGESRSGEAATTNNDHTKNDLFNNNDLIVHSTNALDTSAKKEKINMTHVNEIFERVWLMYPLKKAKQRALASLGKILKGKDVCIGESMMKEILNGLAAHLAEREAQEQLKQQGAKIWIPELPHLATWLNQKRWEDEYQTPEQILTTTHAANDKRLDLDAFSRSIKQQEEMLKGAI